MCVPHTVGREWCWSVTPYRKSDSWNILHNIWNCTHGMMAEKKYVNGEWSILRRYQTCRRQTTNETRKEGLKNYVDVTIYTIASYAKLDWYLWCATTSFPLSSCWHSDTSFSLRWLKGMQLAHTPPHNVLHSPSWYLSHINPWQSVKFVGLSMHRPIPLTGLTVYRDLE